MKRFQIGLRLLLLIVALLATCAAWQGAIRSRRLEEQAIERMNLEAKLRAEERWRSTLRQELQAATSPSLVRSVSLQLPVVESRIAAMRAELESANP